MTMNVNDDDGSKYDENWNYDIYDDNGDAGLNINDDNYDDAYEDDDDDAE